jgi:flagellar basal body rod protein FlgG
MFRGIYSVATAMNAAAQSQEITAYNLANATVPGYRTRGVQYETFNRVLDSSASDLPALGTQIARGFTDFTSGGLQQTGEPLDLAVKGDGFFVVQGPNGPMYTRDGAFRRTPRGEVLTTGGYPLLGRRGPLVLPAGALDVSVGPDGSVRADGNPLDRLQLVSFQNPKALQPVGTTLFSAPAEAGLRESTGGVVQGAREGSNVQPANEMVNLMAGLRYFEMSARAMRTISEAVQLITRPN